MKMILRLWTKTENTNCFLRSRGTNRKKQVPSPSSFCLPVLFSAPTLAELNMKLARESGLRYHKADSGRVGRAMRDS